MYRTLFLLFATLACGARGFSESPGSKDWSQWRGPSRSAVIDASDWPASIDEQHLVETWRVPLGNSYSGPIVDGDHVYVTEMVDDKTEAVMALDRKTGQKVWRHQWAGGLKVPFFAAANGSWIRATPAIAAGRLFVGGMSEILLCLDAATGKPLWQIDMPKNLGSKLPTFGFVSSPLVDRDSVYVQAGGGLIRFNAASGVIVWHSLKDGSGMGGSAFSSPVIATLHGLRQLVVQTRRRLVGIDMSTGDELWSTPIPAFRGMNILTPTVIGNAVFTSSYGGGSFMFDVRLTGKKYSVHERWNNKREGYMASPVVIDGHIYLHMRNQRFACIHVATGEELWATRPYGKYWSMIAAGKQILALDQRGELRLINANASKFDMVEERHVSDSPSWGHLAISGHEIFIRELDAIVAYRWK